LSGVTATFTITAQNTGNVDLSNVTVADVPPCDTLTGPTGDTDGDNELDTTETWSWTCTVTNVTADFTNTAVVSGISPLGTTVTDTDQAVVVVTPKTTPTDGDGDDGDDNDDEPPVVSAPTPTPTSAPPSPVPPIAEVEYLPETGAGQVSSWLIRVVGLVLGVVVVGASLGVWLVRRWRE